VPKFSIPQLRPNQVAILLGVVGTLVLVIFSYFFFKKPAVNIGVPVQLTVWGTESQVNMDPILNAYHGLHSNVTLVYTAIDPAEYQGKLLNALASSEGPDVFTVQSTDVGMMKSKLIPSATLTSSTLQTLFPKAVVSDVVDDEAVYGLPLSLDTLVLIYNRDLFDAAGITTPPATWDDVVADVPLLSAVDDQSQLQRQAIALGGSSASIRDAADIISLLMLQDGSPLSNQAHSSVLLGPEGESALRFYTQFANPASAAYSWNDTLGDSFQQFADGKVAMLITYPSALSEIKARNPYIDARIAGVPQAKGGTPKSYGSYTLLGVSKQSKNSVTAWDFVQSVTTNKAIVANYSEQTGRTPALTAVIGDLIKQSGDVALLATQALQARSWYQTDGSGVRREIDRAINDIVSGASDTSHAARILEQRIRALIQR
jgi:ABC-type glycerol-3-phosphate transport system substrate-binding protein